jgi:hypothetical protein
VRTFIVRIQEDAEGSGRPDATALRLRGVVDEVATGLRATFRNDSELVAALLAAVRAGPPSARWDSADGSAPDHSSDRPRSTFEEK